MVERFNTRSFLALAFSLVTYHGQNDVAKATCLAIGRTSWTVSTSSFHVPTGKAMTSVHRAGERKRHTSSQVDLFSLGCRAWNVIPLGMSESLDGDPEEEPGILNDVVGGDISLPTTDGAGIGGISREYFIVGGFLGILSLGYEQGLKEQRAYRERKQRLFRSIAGEGDGFRNILEVGVGGNPKVGGFSNLGFYRPGQSIVGIDPALSDKPSPDLENAQKRAMEKGLTLGAVGGVAEDLPFESGSFDAVVSTMVFCSVRDPAAALREVSRVLRPGGKFVFVEHVHAPDEGLSVFGLRQQQDLLDPLQQLLADGCHLTRETDRLIREASSGSPAESRLFSRIESIESVRVKSMWPVSEQVFGVVVK